MTSSADTVHLYGMNVSTGCRLVQWVANICDVPFEFHTVDIGHAEHMKPAYVKQTRGRHCLPSMVHEADGERLCITESRAIARYLIRIGSGNICEFHNPLFAAEVDELVDYEATCLYKRVAKCAYPRLFSMGELPETKDFEAVEKSLEYIEERLGQSMHLVGGTLTLADVLLANTLSMLVIMPEIDIDVYPAVKRWLGCLYRYGNYDDVARDFYAYSEEIVREEDLMSTSESSDDDESLFSEEGSVHSVTSVHSLHSVLSGSESEKGLSRASSDDDDDEEAEVLSLTDVSIASDDDGEAKQAPVSDASITSITSEDDDNSEAEPACPSTTSDGYGKNFLQKYGLADNSTDTTNLIPQPCCGNPCGEPKE